MENQNAIIFIDELHTLVGAGSAEGSLDAANILKPALSRGEIQCIGATTPGEFRKSIEKDRSLERRFQAVKVPPPDEADACRILFGIKERYEKFHAVVYTDDAIETSVFASSRFIPDRYLPDKAIDLIDEAGARVKLRQTTLPPEISDIQKRIKFIVHRMESPSRITSSRRRGSTATRSARNARTCGRCGRSTTWTNRRRGGDEGRHRGRGGALDRRADDGDQGRRSQQADPHRRRAAQARGEPGAGDRGAGAGHPAIARGSEIAQAAGRLVPVPGADGRGQDGSGAGAGRVPLRQRKVADPVRHVGVHGEALGVQADRLAAGLCGLRRGRPIDRARAARRRTRSSCWTRSRRPIRTFTTSCCRCSRTAS